MPEQATYCIDTSALIDLNKWYPIEVFPTLWGNLDDLVQQGRLTAPREVLKEIERKDDDLLRWVKDHRNMFTEPSPEQLETVKDILRLFPNLIDHTKSIPDADPFVIALALVKNKEEQSSFFAGKCLVVTQEKPSRGDRPKIPDVCQHYGVECITGPTALTDLFKKEDWKF